MIWYSVPLLVVMIATQVNGAITTGSSSSKIELTANSSQFEAQKPLDFDGQLVTGGTQDELSGDIVTATNGLFDINGAQFILTGTYDSQAATSVIRLAGSDKLRVLDDQVLPDIRISGIGNRIEGPLNLSQPLYLSPGATAVTLALDRALNDQISLNDQSITLEKDLCFDTNVTLSGIGHISCSGHSFMPHDGLWTSTLYFPSGTVIDLAGDISLSGMWILDEVGGTSSINGHGHTLDLSMGGTIWVRSGHGCLVTDLVVIGLGDDRGRLFGEDSSATFSLNNTVLSFDNAYSLTVGQWHVSGQPTHFISRDNLLSITALGKLTVDATTLVSETLEAAGQRMISPLTHDGVNLALLSDARISSPNATAVSNYLYVDAASYSQTKHEELKPDYKLVFRGDQSSSMIYDGAGYSITAPRDGLPYISAFPGNTVIFKNVVFKDFMPSQLDQGSAEWLFGDGAVIEFASGSTVDLSKTFTCVGNVRFDCKGSNLDISVHDGIVGAEGSQVTIADGRLTSVQSRGAQSGSVHASHPSAQITFSDIAMQLDADYTLSYGSYFIDGMVCVMGDGQTLAFTSTSNLTINAESRLQFDRGTTFSYDAQSGSKTALVMADTDSVLAFDHATLVSTMTGVTLSTGQLEVDGIVTFSGSATNFAEGIELASSLDGYCRPGGTLNVATYVVHS
jgi:phage baseplate assembly protein gpV